VVVVQVVQPHRHFHLLVLRTPLLSAHPQTHHPTIDGGSGITIDLSLSSALVGVFSLLVLYLFKRIQQYVAIVSLSKSLMKVLLSGRAPK